MNAYWTPNAEADLAAIREFLSLRSVDRANDVTRALVARGDRALRQPFTGSIVEKYNDPAVREVFERPYRVIYRILADGIDILAVVHHARQLPRKL